MLAAMKVVRPMMETGQTQTWLLRDGIWAKSGSFRVVAAVPGMMTEKKMGFAAMPVAVAFVSPAATAFAVLLPGLRSGPALASEGQGPPCFQDPHFDQGAAATPAATLAAMPCETESKGYKLNEGVFAVPGLPICWWRAAEKFKGDLDSGCEFAVPELPICWWRAAETIQGDVLDSGESPSGSLLPCETVSKGYKLNEGELAVPGLPICWWAAAEKAAAAHACDDYKIDSSSCAAANSSSNEASIWGTCQKEKEKMIQFFVNKGNGSEVVRCCPHAIVSHVLDYGSEGYAVCGTRTLRPGDSFQQNGIESGMMVRLLFRLRGGSGGNNVDIPGQWQCSFCHATRCWPTRKRCYRCDTPRDFSAVDGPVRGPLGRAPLPARNNVPPTRSSGPGPGPQTVPPRNMENVPPPQRSPPGAGVGPISADIGKKDEGGDLVQALSLLQKIMTPEDFVKYQLLVSPKPKPKPEKTREQELADKVKNLERYRSQEASHKGLLDKYELDLQRQRNMLRGVVEQIRLVEDEIKDLRVQVAQEKSDSSDGDNASIRTAPATQVDSQPDMGEDGLVVNTNASTSLHPGPFESCDEDMLCSASEAEDERDVRRNGIWERRRSGVIKKGRLLKVKAKAKPNKTIIIEEEGESPPPGPPPHGKHLADVLTGLSKERLQEVLSHCPPSFLQSLSSVGDPGNTSLFG